MKKYLMICLVFPSNRLLISGLQYKSESYYKFWHIRIIVRHLETPDHN